MTSEIDLDLQRLRIAIPADHDATKPLPLLVKANPENPNCWATGSGDQIFTTMEHAQNSMTLQSAEYKEVNAKRYDLSRFVKATVVPEDDNMVTLEGGDYFTDVQEMLERLGDDVVIDGEPNLPAWCFTTTRHGFDLDIEGVIESYMSDNHHEDAFNELVGFQKLSSFWVAWCAKQTVSSFYIDYSRIIVIDQERYERELAEAKAWLEASPHG
ncbi:hypothetical protein LJR231_001533 [Phyllobacterium sp. LjRoot231]|uniref:hypothetical protein n=1 Tax=Phyllobacterium sp. LjRoot231 TaxID=3342289 RepID=UPI003ECFD9AF